MQTEICGGNPAAWRGPSLEVKEKSADQATNSLRVHPAFFSLETCLSHARARIHRSSDQPPAADPAVTTNCLTVDGPENNHIRFKVLCGCREMADEVNVFIVQASPRLNNREERHKRHRRGRTVTDRRDPAPGGHGPPSAQRLCLIDDAASRAAGEDDRDRLSPHRFLPDSSCS